MRKLQSEICRADWACTMHWNYAYSKRLFQSFKQDMKKHLNYLCLRELRWEQPGSCWNGCSRWHSHRVSEGFALQQELCCTAPESFASCSPVSWRGFLQQLGKGCFWGTKSCSLRSHLASQSLKAWIMFIGFSQQLPLGLEVLGRERYAALFWFSNQHQTLLDSAI